MVLSEMEQSLYFFAYHRFRSRRVVVCYLFELLLIL